MIENKDLKVFVAVAETGSFTLAAERLYLTQSAVSKRLGHLEQQLGLTLIQRQERPWKLSQAGERLLPEARQLLASVLDVEQSLRQQEIEPSGTLDLAVSHHLSLYRLPSTIKNFKKRFPKVQLNLSFLTSDEVHHAVAQKQIELGYATLKTAEPTRLTYQSIWEDELIFVGSRSDIWTSNVLSFEKLCQRPAVLPQTSSLYFQMVNQLFLQAGCSITQLFPANYLETVRSMVSVGLGWSVLPKAMLDKRLLELHLNEAHTLSRSLGALHRQSSTLSPAANAFLEMTLQTSNT